MSELVVIGFDDELKTFELCAELAKMQQEYLIEMEDVVAVTANEKGKVKLHQVVNLTAAGSVGGSFWGMLIGMMFAYTCVREEWQKYLIKQEVCSNEGG